MTVFLLVLLEILSRAPEDVYCCCIESDDNRESRKGPQDLVAGVLLLHFPCARTGGVVTPQRWLQEELEESVLHSTGIWTLLLYQRKAKGEALLHVWCGIILPSLSL